MRRFIGRFVLYAVVAMGLASFVSAVWRAGTPWLGEPGFVVKVIIAVMSAILALPLIGWCLRERAG